MGLPLCETAELLKAAGINVLTEALINFPLSEGEGT
jgi:hypothetical protein